MSTALGADMTLGYSSRRAHVLHHARWHAAAMRCESSEKEKELRRLILCMTLSLDGVAAPETNDAFDFTAEGAWGDKFAMLESVDTILIGAAMHEEYPSHWHASLTSPAAGENERRYAEIAARTPHLVLSRTLREVKWPNAKILNRGVDGIADLKQQAGGDILMWGGPTVAPAAIQAGFIDEYHFVMYPVIAGLGKKLFDQLTALHRLRLEGSKTYSSGILGLKYASA